MVLIDTNVFMRLANGAHGAERIERPIIEVTAKDCFINPVIASALLEKIESGAGRVKKRALQCMADILATVQCIDMDCASGQESGLIRAEQSKKGKPVATPDALIAGRARHAGMIIVTDDTRHVGGITRLKLENWRAWPRASATWLPESGQPATVASRRLNASNSYPQAGFAGGVIG